MTDVTLHDCNVVSSIQFAHLDTSFSRMTLDERKSLGELSFHVKSEFPITWELYERFEGNLNSKN